MKTIKRSAAAKDAYPYVEPREPADRDSLSHLLWKMLVTARIPMPQVSNQLGYGDTMLSQYMGGHFSFSEKFIKACHAKLPEIFPELWPRYQAEFEKRATQFLADKDAKTKARLEAQKNKPAEAMLYIEVKDALREVDQWRAAAASFVRDLSAARGDSAVDLADASRHIPALAQSETWGRIKNGDDKTPLSVFRSAVHQMERLYLNLTDVECDRADKLYDSWPGIHFGIKQLEPE